MISQTVSHYQILEKLGEGGMGVVYKARDTHLDRFVAVKVLPPEKVADPERKRRFVQEAKAASALNHPNIVHIYDIASDAGTDFIAMEYVAGKTLDALIPRKGMRLSEALKIAVQVADALAKAHAAGIVHRDLKPGNVMVDEHGLVKVLDFGLAKLAEPMVGEGAATQTAEGAIVGTVGYMSPEQAEGKPVDARSDIFSFGSLLYEMVSGRRAFQGDSNMSTLAAILNQEPAPLGAEAPRDLEKMITRCLRKDPARRWQNMADLKVALEELKEESDSGRLAAVAPPVGARHASPLRLIVVVVVVLAAVGWFAWRQLSPAVPLMTTVPLTSFPGNETQPAFSPDGNFVAFVWNGPTQDNWDIYVQQIGSGAPLRLTSDPAYDHGPDFSPDGRQIAFVRGRAGRKWEVLVVPALGGAERQVGTVAAGFPWLRWTPDGRFLVAPDRTSPQEPAGIYLLSLDTGEKRRLTSPPQGSPGDAAALVAPNGEALLVYRMTSLGLGDLYLVPLGAGYQPRGEAQRLTSDNSSITGVAWAPDSRGVVFSSRREGSDVLWRLEVGSGRPPERLAAVGGEWASFPAIAPRGRRLVYARTVLDANIWRLELAAGGAPAQWIASTQTDENPRYSPDGSRIAFVSTRSGQRQIWVSDSAGGNLVQVTSLGPNSLNDPRWSPDGGRIAFVNTDEGRWHSYVVSASGGLPQRLTTGLPEDRASSWSRDGRWIYLSSQRQVWKAPWEPGAPKVGQPVQVTRDGGLGAVESPDGKFLYYAKAPDFAAGGAAPRSSLWRVPVAGGEEVEVAPAALSRGGFELAARGVYLLLPAGAGGHALHFFDFAARTSRLVATLATEKPLERGFSVSPDGRYLLYTQVDQRGSDLMLIENFR